MGLSFTQNRRVWSMNAIVQNFDEENAGCVSVVLWSHESHKQTNIMSASGFLALFCQVAHKPSLQELHPVTHETAK